MVPIGVRNTFLYIYSTHTINLDWRAVVTPSFLQWDVLSLLSFILFWLMPSESEHWLVFFLIFYFLEKKGIKMRNIVSKHIHYPTLESRL